MAWQHDRVKNRLGEDAGIESYSRYAPYVIVVAGVVGALVGGASLWIIPLVIVVSIAFAYAKVKATQSGGGAVAEWINRRRRGDRRGEQEPGSR